MSRSISFACVSCGKECVFPSLDVPLVCPSCDSFHVLTATGGIKLHGEEKATTADALSTGIVAISKRGIAAVTSRGIAWLLSWIK